MKHIHHTSRRSLVRRPAHFVVAALAAIGCMFITSSTSLAWTWPGPRWGTTPTSGCCLNLTYQSFGTGDFWDDDDYYAFANGYDSWTHSSHSASNVQFSSGTSSAVTVSDLSNPNVSWDGITTVTSSGGHISSAPVYLNIVYTENYDWPKRQGVAAHEIGHQLGLGHATGCVIMVSDSYSRWDTCGIFVPATDDYNGIDAHY